MTFQSSIQSLAIVSHIHAYRWKMAEKCRSIHFFFFSSMASLNSYLHGGKSIENNSNKLKLGKLLQSVARSPINKMK